MSPSKKSSKLNSDKYLRLVDGVVLRRLEKPYIFDSRADELYEINDDAANFVKQCNGTKKLSGLRPDRGFLDYCLEKNLMELTTSPQPRRTTVGRKSPTPSLRYLELQLTDRCNLKCKHCYLGKPGNYDMPLNTALKIMGEFDEMQGLRLILSGGEPLLYKHFDKLNERLPEFSFRKVIISNGEKITRTSASKLNVEEIQVSLDGMEKGHDILRGRGSFKRAMKGVRVAQDAGIDISIATMIHSGNLDEFDELEALVKSLDAREWGIDVPLVSGNLGKNEELLPEFAQAAKLMGRAIGGSYHGGDEGEAVYACGLHLCTIMPNGDVTKCGFYANDPAGHVSDRLRKVWKRIKPLKLTKLDCHGCEHISACVGGCRYRAEHPRGVDPVMCHRYGVA